jgi:hypothetical protein
MESFRETLSEWVAKVEGIVTREQLSELYWEEVFSKVDTSSYSL